MDGKEMTEKQLRSLFDQHGLRQESSYILEHLLPKYKDTVYEMLVDAESTDDLLRAQGAAMLLKDITINTNAALKKAKKVEV